jgi:hypothetical protein
LTLGDELEDEDGVISPVAVVARDTEVGVARNAIEGMTGA